MTLDPGSLLGRGIAFPPRINEEGNLSWSEGSQNIRESIRIILMTDLGERLMRPSFGGGLTSLLFEPNSATTQRLVQERVTRSLQRWEPRIRVDSVTVQPDSTDLQKAIVTIEYTVVATAAAGRVTLTARMNG